MDGKVPPRRVSNAARRSREYLTADEVERLMAAARARPSRYGSATPPWSCSPIHGLRVSELSKSTGMLSTRTAMYGTPVSRAIASHAAPMFVL
jgi:hypothetical protein